MKDIEVGLRVKPLLDQAIAGLRQLRGEAQEATKAGQQAGQAAQKAATTQPTGGTGAAPGATPSGGQPSKQTADEAARAAAELQREQRALDQLAGSLGPAASAAERLAGVQQQLDAALAKGLLTQEKHAALLGLAKDRYDEDAAALRRLTGELNPASTGAEKLAAAQQTLNTALAAGKISQAEHTQLMATAQQRYAQLGVSAGQTAQAMRQLPAQITDVVTSLASGMPAWLVTIQQGGQIRDSFGSIGGAAKGLLTVLRTMVNPWLVLAGAAAGVAVAYKQGSEEAERYQNALDMTGHVAGVSSDQLADMAKRIDGVVGTTAQAADALAQLVESGQQGGTALEAMGRAAVAMNEATGKAVSTTVAEFAKLRGDPLKAVEELNNKYHFLTAAVYAQIKALSEQGDKDQAAEVAQLALAKAFEDRAGRIADNMGYIDKFLKLVKNSAKEMWDALLDVGRADTLEDKLKAAQDRLKAQQERNAGLGIRDGLQTQKLGAEVAALAGAKYAQEANAKAIADAQQQQEARIAWDKEADKYLSGRTKLLTEHTKNLKRINAEAKAAGADDDPQLQAELRQRVAQETERYKKELNSLPNPALQNAKAAAELTAAQLQQNLQLLQASITSGDAIVTYALEKGQVTIEAAYQARLGMIQTENQAQREALAKERQEIEKELKLAVKPEERDAARKRVVEVETKAKLLDSSLAEATRKLSIWKTEQERSLATITAKVRVDVAGITGQFDRQAIQDQLKLQYQGDYEAAGRLNPEEAAAARERIDLLVAAGAAQAEFNAKLAEAQRLQQAQAAIEAAIQQRVSTGQISQIEGEAKIQQARAAQVPLLQAIVDGLERIKGAMPTDAAVAIDQMTTSIAEMRNTVASSTPVIVDWGTKAKNTAIDGLADAAANAVTQFSSLRDMVSGTLKNIAADLVRSDIKRLLMNLFKMDAGGGGGGGGAGSFIGAIWSGARSIFGFAEGGQIRGPGTGASDSVPALVDGRRPVALSNGEWIQPVKAVQHYGAPFMEAVRTLRLPKPSTGYALGGLVQASQRARFATGGAVAAAAAAGAGGAAPNVVFQMTNTGTPQRVVRQSSSFEGKDLVVRVLLPGVTLPVNQSVRQAVYSMPRAQAQRLVNLLAASKHYHRRTITWESTLFGLTVATGDVIHLAHDLTAWAASGRLVALRAAAGRVVEVELSREVELPEGDGDYWLWICPPGGDRFSVRCAPPAGRARTLAVLGAWPQASAPGWLDVATPNTAADPFFADTVPEDWTFLGGPTATPGKRARIIKMEPSGARRVRITARDEVPEYYPLEWGLGAVPEVASGDRQVARAYNPSLAPAEGGGWRLSWELEGATAAQVVVAVDGGAGQQVPVRGHLTVPGREIALPSYAPGTRLSITVMPVALAAPLAVQHAELQVTV